MLMKTYTDANDASSGFRSGVYMASSDSEYSPSHFYNSTDSDESEKEEGVQHKTTLSTEKECASLF